MAARAVVGAVSVGVFCVRNAAWCGVGFYPYPFIDVAKLGFQAVVINAVLISVVFFVAGLLLIAADRAWPFAEARRAS